jgi:hypothetical protein
MCLAPTRRMTKVRLSTDSPHQVVISHRTPECQYPWFRFYWASNFYYMAIAAGSSSPTGPPLAADWVAASVAAALETSVTAAAVVASAPIATIAAADSIIIAANAAGWGGRRGVAAAVARVVGGWSAYNDGDIVTRIKKSILLHDGMRVRFSRLLGSGNEVNNQLILSYIIERYANIRGTYFVRHLKGNSGNQIQKLADSQATQTKVAHAVVYAKKEESNNEDTFISDNTPECRALWETATDNVFELADTDDDDSHN